MLNTIGIISATPRTSALVQRAAEKGMSVLFMDRDKEALESSVKKIKSNLRARLEQDSLTEEEALGIMDRTKLAMDFEGLKDCEVVIHSSDDDFDDLKDDILKLDSICLPEAVIAIHSGVHSLTKLAQFTSRPTMVAGFHLLPSLKELSVVELVQGVKTCDEAVSILRGIVETCGLNSVVSRDFPGGLFYRITYVTINEAIQSLFEGVGSVEAIDAVMKGGLTQSMGPLALADFLGLKKIFENLKILYEETGDIKYKPCPLLVKHVEAGHLGRETGKGFYEYE